MFLFSAVLVFCAFFVPFSGNKIASAATSSASVLNIDNSGSYTADNIKNALGSGSVSKVYFGKNTLATGQPPQTWYVLDSNYTDDGGNSGGVLLFSVDLCNNIYYNYSGTGLNNTFWYLSFARAYLNGYTQYYTNGSAQTNTASFISDRFTAAEQSVIRNTTLKTVGYWYNSANPVLTHDSFGVTDPLGGGTLNNGSAVLGTNSSEYGIQETTVDKVFLLDYNDIYNTAYGFNAHPLGSSYDGEQSGYYATNGNGNISGIAALSESYWLRNPGRAEANYCSALIVHKKGFIASTQASDGKNGEYTRPATNLNADDIFFASANSGGTGISFSDVTSQSVDGKPIYKLWFKNSDYEANSASFKPKITSSGSTLTVKYTNPASAGNISVLLTKRNASGGAVEYRATASSVGGTGTATFTSLPTNYKDYDVTVMLTSANGGNNSESVYASYTRTGLNMPENVGNLTYDGNNHWLDTLNADWIDKNLHTNTDVVNIDISYKGFAADATEETVTSSQIINAGTYTVKMKPKGDYVWDGGGTDEKSFTITIAKADPTVNATQKEAWSGTPYISAGLPELENTGGTAGTFSWGSQTAKEGTNEYEWTFTPEDSVNYNTVTKKETYTYLSPTITGITATFDPKGDTIYDNMTYESLRKYITVTATYDDSNMPSSPITTYTVPSGNITSGDSVTFTVRANNKAATVTVPKVEKAAVESIEIEYDNFAFTYSEGLSYEELSEHITVFAHWNYGDNHPLTDEEKKSLVFSGEIAAGNPEITVTYSGVSSTFKPAIKKGTYDLSAVELENDDIITVYGEEYAVTLAATVPDGVTPVYLYENADKSPLSEKPVNAGEYTVTVTFTQEDTINYETITKKLTGKIRIEQARYEIKATLSDRKQTYDGEAKGLELVWEEEIEGVEAVYLYESENPVYSSSEKPTEAGEYTVTVSFKRTEPKDPNYADITETRTATLIITTQKLYSRNELITINGEKANDKQQISVTYSESGITITVAEKVKDTDGANEVAPVKVTATYYDENGEKLSEIKNVGKYTVKVKYEMSAEGDYADYETELETEYSITVEKADFDMSGISLNDKTFEYDGEEHGIAIEGTLPDWIEVTYDGNGKTEIGSYTVTVTFTHNNPNYNDEIAPMQATFTIEEAKALPDPVTDEPVGGESNFLKDNWMYILIGVGVLLLFIILIVALTKRKARADDYYDDEYDYDEDDDEDDDDEDY